MNLQYSNTNNVTYQVPLFFILAEQGPDNQIVQINSQNEFIQTYGTQPVAIFEPFIYAYRTSALTPIYCYKIAPPIYSTANFCYALVNVNNVGYILPGYIDNNMVFNTFEPFTNITLQSTLYQPLISISAFYSGTNYIATLYIQNNSIIIDNENISDIISLTGYSNSGLFYSYTINNNSYSFTNIQIWYNGSFTSITLVTPQIAFVSLTSLLFSYTFNIYINSSLFLVQNSNTFNEPLYINAIESMTFIQPTYVKYLVSPVSLTLSATAIDYINQLMLNLAINNYQEYAGSLVYAFINSMSNLNSNLFVAYNQTLKIYYPEIGTVLDTPAHYEALYRVIQYRLQANDNSTTLLTFNDIYIKSISNYTNQFALNFNQYSSYTDYNINQITITYKGLAQTTFKTTYNGNTMLVYEYVNADLLDLMNRLYRRLVVLKHQLNITQSEVYAIVSFIIANYHSTMIENFYVNVYPSPDPNTILIGLSLKYKRIAELVNITLRV